MVKSNRAKRRREARQNHRAVLLQAVIATNHFRIANHLRGLIAPFSFWGIPMNPDWESRFANTRYAAYLLNPLHPDCHKSSF
jgi:hypothetical protein